MFGYRLLTPDPGQYVPSTFKVAPERPIWEEIRVQRCNFTCWRRSTSSSHSEGQRSLDSELGLLNVCSATPVIFFIPGCRSQRWRWRENKHIVDFNPNHVIQCSVIHGGILCFPCRLVSCKSWWWQTFAGIVLRWEASQQQHYHEHCTQFLKLKPDCRQIITKKWLKPKPHQASRDLWTCLRFA